MTLHELIDTLTDVMKKHPQMAEKPVYMDDGMSATYTIESVDITVDAVYLEG